MFSILCTMFDINKNISRYHKGKIYGFNFLFYITAYLYYLLNQSSLSLSNTFKRDILSYIIYLTDFYYIIVDNIQGQLCNAKKTKYSR